MGMKITRRKILAGSAALVTAAIIVNRPADASGPRDPYFLDMQKALKAADIAQPTLVVDRARLNANIDQLMSDLPPGMGYRIVAKSLPSTELLQHVRTRTKTDRLMTFNLPMLMTLSETMPTASQLIGKPFPAQAAQNYLEKLPVEYAEATQNVQWLIDTPERLAKYQAIGEAAGSIMPINIELDVGLHRGGMKPGSELDAMLKTIKASNNLKFAGFMGYEPHVAKIPVIMGWQARVKNEAWNIYRAAINNAQSVFGQDVPETMTRNAAGSPTYRLYKDTGIANEISAGSALVKPVDFDTELLRDFQPASFVATPVIKSSKDMQTAGLEFADGLKNAYDPNLAQSVFIHGGHWLAAPVDPPGLRLNSTFGRSSNQELLNAGASADIAPDDFVFLRPTQSEAVFLQFGDIAVYENGQIVEKWSVFPASA
tara:strand:- start:85925 stop:87208 length:1284 start_codon:yes stop_codon:yes gene_type:complete